MTHDALLDPLSTPAALLTALRHLLAALDAQEWPPADDALALLAEARLMGAVAVRLAETDLAAPGQPLPWRVAANDAAPVRELATLTRARLTQTVCQMEALLRQAKGWLEGGPC